MIRIKRKKLEIEYIILGCLAVSTQTGCMLAQIDRLIYYFLMVICVCITCIYTYKMKSKIEFPQIGICIAIWICYTVCISVLITWVESIEFNWKRLAYDTSMFVVALPITVVAYNIARVKKEKEFLKVFSVIVVVIFCLQIILFITGIKPLYSYFGKRYCGIAGNPNDYVVVAYMALAYFLNIKNCHKVARVVSLICLLIAIFLTGSRSAIVIMPVYFFIFLFEKAIDTNQKYQKLYAVILILGTALLGVGICFLPYLKPLLDKIGGLIPSFERMVYFIYNPREALGEEGSMRIQAWIGAILLISKSPLMGVGIGNTSNLLQNMGFPYYRLNPHNMYLELISQSGILIFIAIMYTIICNFRKSIKFSEDDSSKVLRHCMYWMMLDGLTHPLYRYMIFWLFAGLYLGKSSGNLRRKLESELIKEDS